MNSSERKMDMLVLFYFSGNVLQEPFWNKYSNTNETGDVTGEP